jgi:hypothetical protein
MSGYAELLMFMQQQQEGLRLQRFLDSKGYGNPHADDFDLNSWTNRLILRRSDIHDKTQDPRIELPDHLISFLSIPAG